MERDLKERIGRFFEARANPSGLVYGVVAVGTLIAAEGARRESYPDVIAASVLALFLYWLAHSYARYFGDRLETDESSVVARLAGALVHEAALLEGGVVPIVAVLSAWAAGARLHTGVTAALWVAGGEILLLEVGAGLTRKAPAAEVLRDVVVGTVLGAGILGIRVLLK